MRAADGHGRHGRRPWPAPAAAAPARPAPDGADGDGTFNRCVGPDAIAGALEPLVAQDGETCWEFQTHGVSSPTDTTTFSVPHGETYNQFYYDDPLAGEQRRDPLRRRLRQPAGAAPLAGLLQPVEQPGRHRRARA